MGGIVGDVPLGQELAGVVDEGDIVRLLRPVDTAVAQEFPRLMDCSRRSRAHAEPRSDLIPGLGMGPVRHLSSCSWHSG